MKQKNNLKSLDQFIEEQYGKRGTPKREKYEKGFEAFKIVFSQKFYQFAPGATTEAGNINRKDNAFE